ncbi:MAG: secretin N-terminal domain-containing protein [Kiritimatiellia bacterium]|jgi:general secretion pathway protein D|nr:secretin N-terminal domain-containing protein [Kiritimatiellia bacterium]
MKTNRIHLCVAGAACALTLGVTLAQDPAPNPAAAPAAAPAAEANPAAAPAAEAPAAPPAVNARSTRLPRPPLRSLRPAAGAPGPAAALSAGDAAEPPGETEAEPKPKTTTPSLKFDNAPTDIILQAYAQETGKTLLIAPDAPKANITLKSQPDVALSREEFIEAIEVVLSMNGIVLEPFGEKFVKVLARKTVRTDGIKILMESPEKGHPEKNRVVSQMIQLKAITAEEAQKALEGFKKPDGLFQMFERTNSILVTDTQENINRMLEIIKFIDQPLVVLEEVNVRAIRYAKAEEIKKRLEEIVAESQKQTQAKEEIKPNVSGAPGFSRAISTRPLPPGLSRLRTQQPEPAASTPNENLATLISDADRGMIRGKVQILADERSNQLIIVTRADNMTFFDKIITVLDVETAPDVKVEVQRLEYADAEEVSTMLNDLIGNATSKKEDTSATGAKPAAAPGTDGRSTSLAEAVAARAAGRPATPNAVGEAGKSKLGQLSKDNIKILADKRTNAIVMMGSPNDLAALKEVIKGMDLQLSQVLIETVVLQVELGDDLKTGMDWVQRGKHTSYDPIYGDPDDPDRITGYTRVVKRDTIFNNGDQMGGGGGSGSSLLGSLLGIGATVASNATDSASGYLGARTGISYFLKSDKLNIAALIEASKSDTRTKVLSSPVLMTVDNKEATLEATSMRYLYKGVRYSGSTQYGTEVPDFEQRDIGLTVKITPRISPNGGVLLTIEETFETVGANQQVGTESYPTVNTRKVQADVSVENMQTVVLGGLVQNEIKTEEIGIPILKDIPWIGKYLFGKTAHADNRSELLVFLTPYVLDNAKDLEAEAARRKAALSDDRPWVDYGWSKSKLADPMPSAERTRRTKQRWATEDANHKAEKEYDKLLEAREEQLEKRAEREAEEALKRAKREAEKASGNAEDREEAAQTEAQLRELLGKLKAKKRQENKETSAVPDAAEPVIRVTDSVEILRKGAGNPSQPAAPEKQPERLLSEEPKKP